MADVMDWSSSSIDEFKEGTYTDSMNLSEERELRGACEGNNGSSRETKWEIMEDSSVSGTLDGITFPISTRLNLFNGEVSVAKDPVVVAWPFSLFPMARPSKLGISSSPDIRLSFRALFKSPSLSCVSGSTGVESLSALIRTEVARGRAGRLTGVVNTAEQLLRRLGEILGGTSGWGWVLFMGLWVYFLGDVSWRRRERRLREPARAGHVGCSTIGMVRRDGIRCDQLNAGRDMVEIQ